MTGILRETRDYSIFELHEFNRDVGNLKYLEASMKKYGWIDAYPMHVVCNGGKKLKIKGGHHRFEAAKKIGIPVKFIVCDDKGISIHELEKATSNWTLPDYLTSFVRMGKPDYIAVKAYVEQTGIPLRYAIALLAGDSAGSSYRRKAFKTGQYKLGNQDHANKVKNIVLFMQAQGVEFAVHSLFVQALSKALWVEDFDISRFKKKIGSHSHRMQKQHNMDSYLDEIERIYNYQSQDKQPIVFLANKKAKQRKVAFFKARYK